MSDPDRSSPGATPLQPIFLAIAGATATGKTGVSLAVAARAHVEIISMDSRQVYRGMDIGTAKADAAARANVPHHGLDLIDPDERYSAGRFARDARTWIAEIRGRGNLPLLVGGTGFFLRALTEPIFGEPPLDPVRVDSLRRWLKGQSRHRLTAWAERLDPERAALAQEGGPQRLSRTLEVALLTGRPLSWWHRAAPAESAGLSGVTVILDLPRDEMDRRIHDRVSDMVSQGLVQEVRALLDAGYGDDDAGMSGTGYREVAAHLRGEVSLEEAIERVRVRTRQYARRQLTWFRHQLPEGAVHVDATETVGRQADVVLAAFERAGGVVPWKATARDEVGS